MRPSVTRTVQYPESEQDGQGFGAGLLVVACLTRSPGRLPHTMILSRSPGLFGMHARKRSLPGQPEGVIA